MSTEDDSLNLSSEASEQEEHEPNPILAKIGELQMVLLEATDKEEKNRELTSDELDTWFDDLDNLIQLMKGLERTDEIEAVFEEIKKVQNYAHTIHFGNWMAAHC